MIHHFVTYYKQNGILKHKSLPCISDIFQHDVHTVYTFQKTIIFNVVKKDLPQIEKLIYFSDDYSGQNHKKTTQISLIFYITIATMHYMQNGISLERPMVKMHVTVLVGQLNKWLLMQACSDLSLNEYCHQRLYSSLPILKYLVSNRFEFLLQKSLKTNIFLRKS